MSQNKDVPGNALASHQAITSALLKEAEALRRFERGCEIELERGLTITGLNVRLPGSGRLDVLVVVKAEHEQGRVVGFQQGDTLAEALKVLSNRLSNGSMNWKEDQYG